MFKIDYDKLLKDIGIKDKIINSFKENFNLSDVEIEKVYNQKVEYHAQKMDSFISEHLTQYFNVKSDKKDVEIDQQLDKMVSDFLEKNKSEEE